MPAPRNEPMAGQSRILRFQRLNQPVRKLQPLVAWMSAFLIIPSLHKCVAAPVVKQTHVHVMTTYYSNIEPSSPRDHSLTSRHSLFCPVTTTLMKWSPSRIVSSLPVIITFHTTSSVKKKIIIISYREKGLTKKSLNKHPAINHWKTHNCTRVPLFGLARSSID